MANLTKMFSSSTADSQFMSMLRGSSVSDIDAQMRQKVYSEVMETYDRLCEVQKQFSGVADVPLLSNQYFNATVSSYVRSWAGELTIERSMDQPTALLWYTDLHGVTSGRTVLPNVGPEDFTGINSHFSTSISLTTGTTEYTASVGKKVIPGSIVVKLVRANGTTTTAKDDSNGYFMAPATVFAANTDASANVNYSTGAMKFNLGAGWVPATGDSAVIDAVEDVAASPEFNTTLSSANNRFKIINHNIIATAEPDMLIAENNLMSIAAMQKAIAVNPADIAGAKLTELYTKLVNQKLVKGMDAIWNGNEYVIDLTTAGNTWYTYTSYLDKFMAELVEVDGKLAERSYKGIAATAYVVGTSVANLFMKLKTTGNFVMNTDSTYINDLIGYYNGIPVFRSVDMANTDGYAVCKMTDGSLAPVLRGVFLPLTNTPAVGNYSNPTQLAAGVYYAETNRGIVPELLMRFQVNADF